MGLVDAEATSSVANQYSSGIKLLTVPRTRQALTVDNITIDTFSSGEDQFL